MSDFVTVNASAAQRLAVNSSRTIVQRKTQAVAAMARVLAPGSMRTKIRTISGAGTSPIGIVVCDHPATLFVTKGTKPHVIVPRQAAVLAFVPRGGGNVVFAKMVKHPGTKPNNFLLNALKLGGA